MACYKPDKETLKFVNATEEVINFTCSIAAKATYEHGCNQPLYVTAAGLYSVLCGSMVKFYMRDGMDEEQARIRMMDLLKPLGDEIDRIFSEHPEHTDPSFFGPPVSRN